MHIQYAQIHNTYTHIISSDRFDPRTSETDYKLLLCSLKATYIHTWQQHFSHTHFYDLLIMKQWQLSTHVHGKNQQLLQLSTYYNISLSFNLTVPRKKMWNLPILKDLYFQILKSSFGPFKYKKLLIW